MKIIHIVDYFQPQLGYQETFLAREHCKLGHEVYIVTSDRYYPFPGYERTFSKLLGKRLVGSGTKVEEGIKTVRIKGWEIMGAPLIYLPDLFQTLSDIKPDVVYCHNMFSITSARIAYLKKKTGYKLIYDTHTADFNTNLTNTIPKKIYYFFYHLLAVPKIKKEADTIFAIGEEEQKFICRDFHLDKKNVPIIRLGVDTERFVFSSKKRDLIRKKLDLREDDILIVFAGKIFPNKDLLILFRAVKNLNDKRIKLLIIGDGDSKYINSLKDTISKKRKVIWINFVPNRELSAYYSAVDFGVWPGNPSIAMLEAMSSRLPLILPKMESTNYLQKSNAVFWFKRDDTEDLSKRIKDLSYNMKTRKTVGRMAREFIIKNLSWEKIAKQTLDII